MMPRSEEKAPPFPASPPPARKETQLRQETGISVTSPLGSGKHCNRCGLLKTPVSWQGGPPERKG